MCVCFFFCMCALPFVCVLLLAVRYACILSIVEHCQGYGNYCLLPLHVTVCRYIILLSRDFVSR